MKYNKFWSTVGSFKKGSLFRRYMTISLITIIIPLLIISSSFIVYNQVKLNSEHSAHAKRANIKAAEVFDNIMNNINMAHFSLTEDPAINYYINCSTYEEMNVEFSQVNELNKIITNTIESNSYVDSIYIYNHSADYIKGSDLSNFTHRFLDDSWIDILKRNNYSDYVALRRDTSSTEDVIYFTICRSVYSSSKYIGSYVFNSEISDLEKMFSQISDVEEVIITDFYGNIIFTNNEKYYFRNYSDLTKDEIDGFNAVSLSDYDYSVYTKTDDTLYTEQMHTYIILIVIAVILVLFCSVISSYILSRHLYKSILDIIGILQQNEVTEYDKKTENEYEFIQRSIMSISDSKKSIEEELAENLALLKKSQVKILQEQINPHFISNTLNLISLLDMAEHKKQTKITTIIRLLSELLGAVIDTNEYIVPLHKELEYTQKYLYIQNIKYAGKFEFDITAPESVRNAPVVKFMLQPIIENAINHGILESPQKRGKISIVADTKDNKLLKIRITNTGKLIEEENLLRLKNALAENQQPTSKHIGLLNVNQRINLVFGEHSNCTIDCDRYEGTTTVTITLPIKKLDH